MKNKLSFLSLIAAAALPCGNALAEAIEGYPVIVYDTSDTPTALGTNLNKVLTYLDGAEGDKAELYADITVSSTLNFTLDSYLYLVSDGESKRTVSGANARGLINFTAAALTLICDNIIFSGGYYSSSSSAYLGGAIHTPPMVGTTLSLGGNAVFSENASETTNSRVYGGAVCAPRINILDGSDYVFSQNKLSCARSNMEAYGGAVWGGLNIGENAEVEFAGNGIVYTITEIITDTTLKACGGAVNGNVTLGKNSTATFSENFLKAAVTKSLIVRGAAVNGNVILKESSTATFSGNSSAAEITYSSYSYQPSCAYGVVAGDVSVGKSATVIFSDNSVASSSFDEYASTQGGGVYGDLTLSGDSATATFSGNSATATVNSAASSARGGGVSGNVTLSGGSTTATFSGNSATASVSENGTCRTAETYGGGICGNLRLSGDSATATFSENTATTSMSGRFYSCTAETYGGGVHGIVVLSGKSTKATFSENSATATITTSSITTSIGDVDSRAYGGAVSGTMTTALGTTATFSGNFALAYLYIDNDAAFENVLSAQGGAIYGNAQLAGNVKFENNYTKTQVVSVKSGPLNTLISQGGAIYTSEYVKFNSTATDETILFSGNSSDEGGAIYAQGTSSTSPSAITFTSDFAAAATFSSNKATTNGGAVRSAGTLDFSGNGGSVTFDSNSAAYGGAIYSAGTEAGVAFNAGNKATFSGNTAGESGGAIYSIGALSFSGSADFLNNATTTAQGGAIWHSGAEAEDGTLYVNAGAVLNFTGNRANASQGGAIYSEAEMSFAAGSKTTFSDNFAAKDGGAIRTTKTLKFLNGGSETHSFSNNATNASGGAIATMNTLTVEEGNTVKFSGNTAGTYGGAIYGGNSSTALSFYSTGYAEFSKNRATSGGAIYSVGRINLLGNFTFSQNQSNKLGGAVYSGSSVTFGALSNGTFSGNSITATTKVDTRGGAVSAGSVTFKGKTTFENNTITAVGSTSINSGGGAVYASGAVTFEGTANVKFEGNTISSSATQSFGGGAIFADTLKLAGTVEFTNNSVKNTTLSTLFSSGGAIFSFSGMEIASGTTATFSGNSAAYGGAINAYKGYLTFTEGASVTFRGNSAARGGAIYADAGTFTLAGDVKFLDNTASAQAGAIQIGEATLECTGDTTRVVFSGNRVGSDSKGWKNNDVLLVKATSAMAIRDAGTYDFGGGILATAGGSLSIDEANVTFRATSATAIGGTTTVSGGATVSMEAGATFTTKALTVSNSGKLVFGTQGAGSASIVVANAANISLDSTVCLELAASSAYAHSARYDLIEWTSGDGSALAAGLTRDNFSVMMNGLACDDAMWIFGVDANSIYVELIPEPSHFGVFAGLAALALAGTRRRRKKA